MMHNSSPYAGLHKVFITLIVIGALAAFAFTNSDLTNFLTNSAKIESMKQQAVIQTLKESIDIANYQKIEDAKTKAQLVKIQTDKELDKKLQAQKLQVQAQQVAFELEISRLFEYGKLAVGAVLAICFSSILLILTAQFGRSRLIWAQTQVKRINSRKNTTPQKQIASSQDVNLRKQIELARERERATRALQVRQTQTPIVPAFYPEEEAPIAWEDLREQFAVARKTQRAN